MKSLNHLALIILDELGDECHVSTTHDRKTVMSRYENEGLSFLTITLPKFGKSLEKGLDQGFVDHAMFAGFSRHRGLPRFLGGFLDLIFDRDTGMLLDVPSIEAIRSLRQFCLMFAKIKIECSPERVDRAFDKYIKCEQSVKASDAQWGIESMTQFSRIVSLVFGNMFSRIDRKIHYEGVIPKHSSGSTADRVRGNAKYTINTWTERMERVFPHMEYLASSFSLALANLDGVDVLEPGREIPVKVITVPKTLDSPRIIAMEPTAVQYVQQGILEMIVEEISRDDILKNLIDWSSQIPNQDLARLGSLTGELATLDLSEASDRVSNQHVRRLLANFPSFAEAVDATRSRKADVNGRVIRLAKFASMGSALCFPMEAMVFLTVILCGIENALSRRLTRRDIISLVGKVRVYGDDIIIPVDYAVAVEHELEAYGFVVNVNKSFWTGKFRESCGKEYYDGHDVSIVKVRSLLPTSRQSVDEVVSTVEFRNHLYRAGYWKTAAALDNLIEGIIPFPRVAETSPALGRFSFLGYETHKMDKDLQRPLVRAAKVQHRIPTDRLDDYGALMKYFLKRGDLPFADEKHLQQAGRPVSSDIIYRMVPSY